jgi:8-oxo-dGTP pyrophosphatase MutT (NUDIX family)
LEVLMLRRSDAASFMPGVWVFPGGALEEEDGEGDAGLRRCAVREVAEEASIELDPASLVPYSRWITPEVVPVRFDTHFFLALAPAHSPPRPDGEETVEAVWIEPARALQDHAEGTRGLVFPTIKHLESLLGYSTSEEAIEAVRGRPIEAILPQVIGDRESHRIVLPGEPGYE